MYLPKNRRKTGPWLEVVSGLLAARDQKGCPACIHSRSSSASNPCSVLGVGYIDIQNIQKPQLQL